MRSTDLPLDAPLTGQPLTDWRRYAALLNAGRRAEAHEHLDAFLLGIARTDRVEGERFCRWLCTWCLDRGRRGLEFPLIKALLLPYLRGGVARGEMPHLRWLVALYDEYPDDVLQLAADLLDVVSTRDLLRAATVADPSDAPAWRRLLALHIDAADWIAHHMHESKLIGTEEEALEELRLAGQVVELAPLGALPAWMLDDLSDLEQLYADWRAYTDESSTLPFPEWAAARGREYAFPTAVYYVS